MRRRGDQAEVEDLHPTALVEEDVLGLEIPVNIPLVVNGPEGVEDGYRDRAGHERRYRLVAGEEAAGEGRGLHVLHDHVGGAVGDSPLREDGGHVGRAHALERRDFFEEAGAGAGPISPSELDRHFLAIGFPRASKTVPKPPRPRTGPVS